MDKNSKRTLKKNGLLAAFAALAASAAVGAIGTVIFKTKSEDSTQKTDVPNARVQRVSEPLITRDNDVVYSEIDYSNLKTLREFETEQKKYNASHHELLALEQDTAMLMGPDWVKMVRENETLWREFDALLSENQDLKIYLSETTHQLLEVKKKNIELQKQVNALAQKLRQANYDQACYSAAQERNQAFLMKSLILTSKLLHENIKNQIQLQRDFNRLAKQNQELLRIKAERTLNTENKSFNPFDYIKSGDKMGMAIYTQLLKDGTEVIRGVESCTIARGGYAGCDFTYASSGNKGVHEHFRDNVHVTRASGRTKVIAANADGKYQSWERDEYQPNEHYDHVIQLGSRPITAIRIQEQPDGTLKEFSEDRKGVLKQAMMYLKAGSSKTYFASRYGRITQSDGR